MEIVRAYRMRWGLKWLVIAIGLLLVVSLLIMVLWNWLGPFLFGWPEISLAKAAGLLLLCRILFGGMRGWSGMHWRQRLAARWERMSPEERERFRAGIRGCCGRAAAEGSDPGKPATTA